MEIEPTLANDIWFYLELNAKQPCLIVDKKLCKNRCCNCYAEHLLDRWQKFLEASKK